MTEPSGAIQVRRICAVVKPVEIAEPLAVHGVRGETCLNYELLGLPGGKVAIHRADDEDEAGEEHQQARQEHAPEDALCHG